jgi:hypothetical protein
MAGLQLAVYTSPSPELGQTGRVKQLTLLYYRRWCAPMLRLLMQSNAPKDIMQAPPQCITALQFGRSINNGSTVCDKWSVQATKELSLL